MLLVVVLVVFLVFLVFLVLSLLLVVVVVMCFGEEAAAEGGGEPHIWGACLQEREDT